MAIRPALRILGHGPVKFSTGLQPLGRYSLRTATAKSRQRRTESRQWPLLPSPVCSNREYQERCYYTTAAPPEEPYPPTEAAILAAASAHIPKHGFTTHSLTLGALDAGYLPATINLFPRGAFDLVLYHLATSRLALKDTVQFPDPPPTATQPPPATAAKVRSLVLARLHANRPIIHKLQEALALMSLPSNIPPSIRELALLADEILYLAGDKDVSASWYTKRAALSGVYASSEMYMTQDHSKDFADTEHFVDRRLEDSETAAYAAGSVGQWLGFTGMSAINVLRSWGAKI